MPRYESIKAAFDARFVSYITLNRVEYSRFELIHRISNTLRPEPYDYWLLEVEGEDFKFTVRGSAAFVESTALACINLVAEKIAERNES